jgi:hypothetical protein
VKRRHSIGDADDCFARRAATELVIAVCEKHSPAVAEVAQLLCHGCSSRVDDLIATAG